MTIFAANRTGAPLARSTRPSRDADYETVRRGRPPSAARGRFSLGLAAGARSEQRSRRWMSRPPSTSPQYRRHDRGRGFRQLSEVTMTTMENQLGSSGLRHWLCWQTGQASWCKHGATLARPASRTVRWPFLWKSGMLKWDGFLQLNDTAVTLLQTSSTASSGGPYPFPAHSDGVPFRLGDHLPNPARSRLRPVRRHWPPLHDPHRQRIAGLAHSHHPAAMASASWPRDQNLIRRLSSAT